MYPGYSSEDNWTPFMNSATELVIKSDSLSLVELVSQATLLVQLVMLLLAIASLVSWTLIFTKAATLKSLRGEAEDRKSVV